MAKPRHCTKPAAGRKPPGSVHEMMLLLRELHERGGAKGMRRAAAETENTGTDPVLVAIFRRLGRVSPEKARWDEMLSAALTDDHRGAQP